MNRTNRIGLLVAAITTLAVVILFAGYVAIQRLFSSPQDDLAGGTGSTSQTTPDPAAVDTDGDGLPDLIENIYRSDPNNPDTDGDGTPDGEEVSLERDPTVPGPNDTLSASAFTDAGLGDPTSFTNQYIASLPENTSREDVLDEVRLEAFIDEQKQQFLPDVPGGSALGSGEESGSEAVAAYLADISASHNQNLTATTSAEIEAAFSSSVRSGDTAALQEIIAGLKRNVRIFESVRPPSEVATLHQKLVAVSQSLLEGTRLLSNMSQDFIGGLIGAKVTEELGPIFAEIATDVAALEEKYDLE